MKTAIVAGCRTPFTRAGSDLSRLTAVELGKIAVRELMVRADVPATTSINSSSGR